MNKLNTNFDPVSKFTKECKEEINKQSEDHLFLELSQNWMNQSWKHKKLTSSLITNDEINTLIEKLLDIGVESAKISGAGGGGFMVILVKPSKRKEVIDYLRNTEGVVYNINFVKSVSFTKFPRLS